MTPPTRHSDSNSSSPQQQRRSSMPITPIHFAAGSPHYRQSASSQYFTTPYQTMGRTSRSVSFNGPSHVRLYDVIGNESVANQRINLAALPPQYAMHNSSTSPGHRSISNVGLLPPASLSELRNRTQQLIERCGIVSRHNSTLSSLEITRSRPRITPDNISYYMQADDRVVRRAMERFGIHDSNCAAAVQLSGFYEGEASKGIHGQTLLPSDTVWFGAPNVTGGQSISGIRSDSRMANHDSHHQHQELDPSDLQFPSETLWIGNLDVQVGKGVIYEAFEQYGPIGSIRVLPEKTCAFVNFVKQSSAIFAHEDVLHRLGGILPTLSRTAPVLLGFGKMNASLKQKRSAVLSPFVQGEMTSPLYRTIPPSTPRMKQGPASPLLATRAIKIAKVPTDISSTKLSQTFSVFGFVENSRILPGMRHGFINFERLDSAVAAYEEFSGKEIFGAHYGPVQIDFARVPTRAPSYMTFDITSDMGLTNALNLVSGASTVPMEQQLSEGGSGVENYRSPLLLDLIKQGMHEKVLEKDLGVNGAVTEEQMIMQVFGSGEGGEGDDEVRAKEGYGKTHWQLIIPELHPLTMEIFDAINLKTIALELSQSHLSMEHVDDICQSYAGHYVQLSIHPLGNTVLQYLFRLASPKQRLAILKGISPYLAYVGIHHHGTWVAQTLVDSCRTEEEQQIIVESFREWAPALMCDKIGNYLCSGIMEYGPELNSFIFDAAVDKLLAIISDRYGARCLLRCLESSQATLYQKKRVATSIVLNSIPLATCSNGALLLTWLLDSSNLPGRYDLISKRFLPHLGHLCNHRIASRSILRIIAQSSEPEASKSVLRSIFLSKKYDFVLRSLLFDSPSGPQFIGKILALSTISPGDRLEIEKAISTTLSAMTANYSPEHHALLDSIARTNSRLNVAGIKVSRTLSQSPSFTNAPPLQPAKLSSRQACSQLLPSFQFISSETKGSSPPYHPSLSCGPQSFAQDKAVTSQSQTSQEPWHGVPLQALCTPEFRPVRITRPTSATPPPTIRPENVPLPVTPYGKSDAEDEQE